MTEFEKKQCGEIYDARDPEIRTQYNRAKDWSKTYNNLPAADAQAKDQVLRMFLGDVGKDVRVNQPFFVDYGYNVAIGDNVVIGAGSVVTESIPDNAIACGNPCKIRKWNPPLKQQVNLCSNAAAF